MERGYAAIVTAQPLGASAELVTIEADLTRGLHAFSIVGLPDKAMAEARDRIAAAIRHAGFKSPKATNRRIILSLSPADLRKEGSHYDVPLALCYLAAAGDIRLPKEKALFTGELALDGTLRTARGVLSQVIAAKRAGIKLIFIPPGNAQEALLVEGMLVYAPATLHELVAHLNGKAPLQQVTAKEEVRAPSLEFDFADIKGQEGAKRALEIAAAGRHNVVLYGPPGTGKTMLARAVPGILPPLTNEELLEVSAIHSIAGTLRGGEAMQWPPFRAPHHTASHTALVGGGSFPRAGEVTLAHNGILFLDELPEFDAQALESLRQPLEDKEVTISRTKGAMKFPADCMVIAALNPAETLRNSDAADIVRLALKQSRKISRPIADRLDLWVEVPLLSQEQLDSIQGGESSEKIRDRVTRARERMRTRNTNSVPNARLHARALEKQVSFSKDARSLLVSAAARMHLSPRAFHRTMRVARTIADLISSELITEEHVLESLQYRPQGMFGFE